MDGRCDCTYFPTLGGIGMIVDIFNTDNKYQIIYADPPWEYKLSGSKKNSRGMAKQYYQTMSTEDICNLPVRNIAIDSTIIFMWATFPNIAETIKVIEAWGFTYKTAAFVWIKQNKKSDSLFWGMGAYTRANAEVCLLGIGKKVKAKELVKSHTVHQIVQSRIEQHSKKPDIVRDRILDLVGDLPRIELFARQETRGWDCWGNEV